MTLALLLTVLAVRPHPAADTLRYTMLLAGNRAGQELVIHEADGSWHTLFEFTDRGRGPKLDTRITLDDHGIPTSLTIAGNDYLKSPVEERFTDSAGTATWSSPAERGSRPNRAGAFYLALNASPSTLALLAQAAWRSPGHRVALLPAGEVAITRLGSQTVTGAGRTENVVHYQLVGLDFTPSDLWLEPDGTLFALLSGWSRLIREGFEPNADRLIAIQDSVSRERQQVTAKQLADHPVVPVVFSGVALFDPAAGQLLPGTTVVVNGNRVTAVGPDGSVAIPAGARRIDGRGKTMLPGLWDMHVHAGAVDGPLNLAAGVTSVRDLANDADQLSALQKSWDEGTALGPRVIKAGFIDGRGPYQGPGKALVTTEAEALGWVDWFADHGYEQIKLYSSLDTALVRPIARRAHARGLRLSGHIPNHMTAAQAVMAGYDEIQHTNMLLLNFLGDSVDTRTPARFTAVGQSGWAIDVRSDSVRAFLALLKSRGTVVDPTLAAFEGMFTAAPGTLSEGDARMAPLLPAQFRRGLLGGGLPASDSLRQIYRESYANMLRMVKALYDAGIPIVAGTDGTAGFTLHRELELYSEAGIPNAEVLRIATAVPAQIMKRGDRLGAVAKGMLADLILVDGNPLADIRRIRRVSFVMKDGVIFDPAAIYRSLGVIPWQEAGSTP